MASDKRQHFRLQGVTSPEPFRSRTGGGGSSPSVPERDRREHGRSLRQQLAKVESVAQAASDEQRQMGIERDAGLSIEFESFTGIDAAFESLARENAGIELLNLRTVQASDGDKVFATVFVPDGKLQVFENLIAAYVEQRRDKRGRPRDNRALIDSIASIRSATVESLWTDERDAFPPSASHKCWLEAWLPVRKNRSAVVATFVGVAEQIGCHVADSSIEFPERTVLHIYASISDLERSVVLLNSIAELRRAKETAEFFDAMGVVEQEDWTSELLNRLDVGGSKESAPHICILDTGVNNGHPILRSLLLDEDSHSIEPAWGTADEDGHGTELAGLAALGDLKDALSSASPIQIEHRLESVKILRNDGGNLGESKLHGYLTIEAVGRAEVQAPMRQRVYSMALTARDGRDRGRPSAWSAAIDAVASGEQGEDGTRRLIVVAAGNIDDPNAWKDCPASNCSDPIQDPGQSWNALTVGAYTELVTIDDGGATDFQPIAPRGGLSPFSTTSLAWQQHRWPLKPDVLFEGGNAAMDAYSAAHSPSLSLLTCGHDPTVRLFTTTRATSAATALAARMAAQIMCAYPGLWPESVRAIIVHSAEWTEAMQSGFLPDGAIRKKNVASLIRCCGYGVPDLERALWSASDSLTMIVEEFIQVFSSDGQSVTLGEMHLHSLPWPIAELEALGSTVVDLRVTLSYFIEPNPASRGAGAKYRYESFGLRFDVKRPTETEEEFRRRINDLARNEDESVKATGSDAEWQLGIKQRTRGSVHRDSWTGTAADLASRNAIAVYPTSGWWKTRKKLKRYTEKARYSLIVSITTPPTEIDIYAAVAAQLPVTIEVAARH